MSYDEHIAQLLQANDIREYRVDSIGKAEASPRNDWGWGSIRIPEVVDGLTYLVALHEIGHVMTHNRRNGKLLREAAAWEWAIENAHIPVSQNDWHEAFMSLENYINQRHFSTKVLGFTARDGARGEFRIPPKSHWFWQTREKLATRACFHG